MKIIFLCMMVWILSWGVRSEPKQPNPELQFPLFYTGPVIGVMTQPYKIGDITEGEFTKFDSAMMDPAEHTHEYIPASYKRYLEMAGAKVMPIIHNTPEDELLKLLDQINGVLFTGGSLDLVNPETEEYHPYTKTSEIIFKYAQEHTDAGDYFPLIGVCQGFQLLNILQSEDRFVLKRSPSMIKNDTLKPLQDFENSRLFSSMDGDAEWTFAAEIVVVNLHNWGIYLADYLFNRPELYNFYRMITYEYDDARRIVVTSIEAFDYPIYAFQYHPERNLFEFSIPDDVCPKTPEARQLSENLIFHFVDEARRNNHAFTSFEDQNKYLLDEQTRVWGHVTMSGNPYYVEIYLSTPIVAED